MAANPTLVIFASDKGPGDATRTAIMSQTGSLLARHGAKLVCLVENDDVPVALLKSACAKGATIELIVDKEYALPDVLQSITIQIIPDRAERLATLVRLADCFVILPGSLATATSHFLTVKELGARVPMVFLNQNNAFEIVRGFSADVFAHTFQQAHKNMQFAENVDEIWDHVSKLLAL
ncbi:MAG TPA: hypothetical protein ENK61_00845 [Devosia sp.]|nr:hypothetical protein [Devosia sp.]